MNIDIQTYCYRKKDYIKILHSFGLLILIFWLPHTLTAQISYNTKSMALGGGGTSYITGPEALFINPANLMFQQNDQTTSITMLQGGTFWHGIERSDAFQDYFTSFRGAVTPFDPSQGIRSPILDSNEKSNYANRLFPDGKNTSTFSAQSELNWLGVKWASEYRSYALSFRTRIGNRFTLGRGIFSNVPVSKNGELEINRSFQQEFQVHHELSFGYAESFTFLNGIQPGSAEFIIGFAPKLIIPGSGLSVHSSDIYLYETETSAWKRETKYNQTSSGILTDQVVSDFRSFHSEPNQLPILNSASFDDLLKPTGLGLGFDIGLTYLITFGDEIFSLQHDNRVMNQSIRFSISFTDIGATMTSRSPSEMISEIETTETNSIGNTSDVIFQGSPNKHYFFLHQLGSQLPDHTGSTELNRQYRMLPASINTGAMFQYHWITIMGDTSYSMVDNAFTPQGVVSYLGTEIRPFHFLPLRAGTRFGKNLPALFSFVTGIETSAFDINASLMIQSDDINTGPFTGNLVGASLLGVRIHL